MDKLIITTIGLLTIAGIGWFFFGKKEEDIAASDTWTITVEGGYKPGMIKIPQGKQSSITFIRKDPNSCLEDVVIPEFRIKQFLPLNKPVTVTLSPKKTGTFGIHCGMNMFHGRIRVI
ncbi:MAG: cupredoxin domain-containing protein [bacterium]|nr:cupredoxin domain-containing protein [bacterium]